MDGSGSWSDRRSGRGTDHSPGWNGSSLEQERNDRYESEDNIARDIQDYLNGLNDWKGLNDLNVHDKDAFWMVSADNSSSPYKPEKITVFDL